MDARLIVVARAMEASGGALTGPQRERLAAAWSCAVRTIVRDEKNVREGNHTIDLGGVESSVATLVSLPRPPGFEPKPKPQVTGPSELSDLSHGDVLVFVMQRLSDVAAEAVSDGPKVSALKEIRETSRERHEWLRANQPTAPRAETTDAARKRIQAVLDRLPAKARRAMLDRSGTEG